MNIFVSGSSVSMKPLLSLQSTGILPYNIWSHVVVTRKNGFAEAILIFLSMLIVACPCAFGIAEPLVLTAAIEWIRKAGIQIFNGNVLALIPRCYHL